MAATATVPRLVARRHLPVRLLTHGVSTLGSACGRPQPPRGVPPRLARSTAHSINEMLLATARPALSPPSTAAAAVERVAGATQLAAMPTSLPPAIRWCNGRAPRSPRWPPPGGWRRLRSVRREATAEAQAAALALGFRLRWAMGQTALCRHRRCSLPRGSLLLLLNGAGPTPRPFSPYPTMTKATRRQAERGLRASGNVRGGRGRGGRSPHPNPLLPPPRSRRHIGQRRRGARCSRRCCAARPKET